MLLFELFNRKKVVKKNNEELIDFSQSTLKIANSNIRIQSFVVINSEMEMRLDLVAFQAWGSDRYLDMLLKFNGISNPFAVETGDIIAIPYLDDMLNNLIGLEDNNDLRESLLDPKKMPEKDQKRLDYLKKKAIEKGANASQSQLPPNFAQPGTNEMTIKDGVVIFGNDNLIKTNCGDTLSKAEFKAKMIKKKIETQGK